MDMVPITVTLESNETLALLQALNYRLSHCHPSTPEEVAEVAADASLMEKVVHAIPAGILQEGLQYAQENRPWM